MMLHYSSLALSDRVLHITDWAQPAELNIGVSVSLFACFVSDKPEYEIYFYLSCFAQL